MGVTLLVLSVGMIPELWKAWSDVLRCRTDGYGALPHEISINDFNDTAICSAL